MVKVLRIEYKKLPVYNTGSFAVDLYATDRVMHTGSLHRVYSSIYTQNTISFVGMNATGKSTTLRLINLAIRIVIDNISLNSSKIIDYDLLADGTEIIVVFCDDRNVYQLHSYLTRQITKSGDSVKYAYKEEILKKKPLSSITGKTDLLNFDSDKVSETIRRSEMDNQIKKILKEDDSIVIMETRDNGCSVKDLLAENYVNWSPMIGDTPVEVLNAFDDNIEYLNTETENGKEIYWVLKFKNSDMVYRTNNPIALNRIISAGTIKGHALIGLAINVLQTGGYLIVDELENHLNKELVHMILNLFNDKKTNPNGACIIFSTHYAEILDFMDRKDNIYITRKKAGNLSVSKFSSEIKRNDIKKSDIFISNCLKGTAPKYQQIQNLKEAICKKVG